MVTIRVLPRNLGAALHLIFIESLKNKLKGIDGRLILSDVSVQSLPARAIFDTSTQPGRILDRIETVFRTLRRASESLNSLIL